MALFDTGTATKAGTIRLVVQVSLDQAGAVQAPVGEVHAELLDPDGNYITAKTAGLAKLSAAMRTSLTGHMTTIRNAINTELAG
jgi:hypothetical protein